MSAGAGHALLGHTGDLTAEGFLEGMRGLRFTGTLALTDGAGSLLLLLAKGQVEASYKLGAYGELGAAGQSFHLNPHEATDLPRLPARNPHGASPLLRALPRLTPPERQRPGGVQLSRLLERLEAARFSGALTYQAADGPAVALLLDGTIRAAVHDAAGKLHSHAEALRALRRVERTKATGFLELEPLNASIAAPLTAFATLHSAPDQPGFSGLEVTAVGYRYWQAGQPFLLVPATTEGPPRRYALKADASAPATQIQLPDEPAGWEEQRYHLTLRGRDALDTMMELGMRFHSEHGDQGVSLLTALGAGNTLQRTADQLGVELGHLKPWLQRFQDEGLLRRAPP